MPLCSGINEPALFPCTLCFCRSSEDATKSSTSPISTDQILGFVDGNPKAKRKEMRDSVSLGFLCLQLSSVRFSV